MGHRTIKKNSLTSLFTLVVSHAPMLGAPHWKRATNTCWCRVGQRRRQFNSAYMFSQKNVFPIVLSFPLSLISTILNLSLFPLSFHISFSFSNCTHYTQTFSFSFSFSFSLSLSLLHYFPQFLQHCIGHLRQHSQRPNRQQSHQKQQTFFLNQKNMMHSISAVKNIAIQ